MKIIYTYTDEAPALATHSFLPVIEAFARSAGFGVELRDISLAGRILAQFPERLTEEQRVPDALTELGELARTPEANIIKLPNISASVPQLKAAVKELQDAGYDIPDYPDEPSTEEEKAARAAYDTVKGSAVNPVLREGNSDRRAPASVKQFVAKHPHSMGAWSKDSASHVSTMADGDFRSTETSVTMPSSDTLRIEHVGAGGDVTVLKDRLEVQEGEIVDSAVMRRAALDAFLAEQIADAKAKGVLFSLHLKATMMKVSDPIIFGHGVRAFFPEIFRKHADALARAGADPNNGLGSVLTALDRLPADEGSAIESEITAAFESGPDIAMVDSDRGITNLHVPSDVIIDASMPAMIRTSGQMWNRAGDQRTPRRSSPTPATPPCTRRRSTSAASTARSTRRRWARRRTSASWRRRPRSTARTTRRSRSLFTAFFAAFFAALALPFSPPSSPPSASQQWPISSSLRPQASSPLSWPPSWPPAFWYSLGLCFCFVGLLFRAADQSPTSGVADRRNQQRARPGRSDPGPLMSHPAPWAPEEQSVQTQWCVSDHVAIGARERSRSLATRGIKIRKQAFGQA